MYKLQKDKYLGNTKSIFNTSQGISVGETEYRTKVYEGWHSHNNAHITLFLKGGTSEKKKVKYCCRTWLPTILSQRRITFK